MTPLAIALDLIKLTVKMVSELIEVAAKAEAGKLTDRQIMEELNIVDTRRQQTMAKLWARFKSPD